MEAVRLAILGALKCLQTGRARLRKQFEGARRARELFGSAPSRSGAVWERRACARESVGRRELRSCLAAARELFGSGSCAALK